MTPIEKKALALVNEQFAGSTFEYHDIDDADVGDMQWALSLAIERHEQFAQEVSDVCEGLLACTNANKRYGASLVLNRFIIKTPVDPLVAVLAEEDWQAATSQCAARFRAALAARGLEITEKKP